ncbi:MAG: hypothetical protein IKP73_18220, partial [Bacteroidales bacterium]|nr:hypothetical protein [Bacteroidales bacterium]
CCFDAKKSKKDLRISFDVIILIELNLGAKLRQKTRRTNKLAKKNTKKCRHNKKWLNLCRKN